MTSSAASTISRLERITQDSADQRAGRAGRLGPGIAVRLWDQRDRLRPHREPDIARIDLAGPVLDVLAWGGDPGSVRVVRAAAARDARGRCRAAPPAARARRRPADAARRATSRPATPPTPGSGVGRGRRRRRSRSRRARYWATVCEDARSWERRPPATSCRRSTVGQQAAPLRQASEQLRRLAAEWPVADRREHLDERELRRALLAGYPDRVARRRETGSPRLLLATGAGAELARDSGVRDAEWLVALDVAGAVDGRRCPGVCRQRHRPGVAGTDQIAVEHLLTDDGRVRATRVTWYDALRLAEAPATPDPSAAASLLADAYLSRAARRTDDAAAAASALHRRRSRRAGARRTGRRRRRVCRRHRPFDASAMGRSDTAGPRGSGTP